MNYGEHFAISENSPFLLGFLEPPELDINEVVFTARHDGPAKSQRKTTSFTVVTTAGGKPEKHDQQNDSSNDPD